MIKNIVTCLAKKLGIIKRLTVTLELVCPDGFSEWQAYSIPDDLRELCKNVSRYNEHEKDHTVKLHVNYFA